MAVKEKESAQIILMQKIKAALAPNISFVDEIATLLKLSNDSAYRRIRGETALSIEEIALLCGKFKFSFDAFIGAKNGETVSLSYSSLTNQLDSYLNYLKRIDNDLKMIVSTKEKEIIYAAEDVPLFHHFQQRELAAFKIFYWNKSILDAKVFENKKFDLKVIDEETLEVATSIYDTFCKIPVVEIWSDDTLNSTIKQIEFYWDSGLFNSKEDVLLICSQVKIMLERIQKQSETGIQLDRKGNPTSTENNFKLYHADVMIGNNCILVNMPNIQATYITYHTFNALSTTNTTFCAETDQWLKNLIRKSNLISGVAEKNRYRFFNHIFSNLNKLIKKIEHE